MEISDTRPCKEFAQIAKNKRNSCYGKTGVYGFDIPECPLCSEFSRCCKEPIKICVEFGNKCCYKERYCEARGECELERKQNELNRSSEGK